MVEAETVETAVLTVRAHLQTEITVSVALAVQVVQAVLAHLMALRVRLVVLVVIGMQHCKNQKSNWCAL